MTDARKGRRRGAILVIVIALALIAWLALGQWAWNNPRTATASRDALVQPSGPIIAQPDRPEYRPNPANARSEHRGASPSAERPGP